MHKIISPTNHGVLSAMYLIYSFFSLSSRIDFELLSWSFEELSSCYSAKSLLKSVSRFQAKIAPSTPALNNVFFLFT